VWLAAMSGIGSALGIYFGGWFADFYAARDPRGRLRAIAMTLVVFAPCALVQFLAGSVTTSLIFGFFAATLMIAYYGPIIAVPQLLVPPNMRAFTNAVLLLVFNLIGLGLGPFVTGALSDVLADRYGMASDSLRYAVSSSLVLSLLAAGLFWRASNYLPAEQLAHEGEPVPDQTRHPHPARATAVTS
jgi:MFS family permease